MIFVLFIWRLDNKLWSWFWERSESSLNIELLDRNRSMIINSSLNKIIRYSSCCIWDWLYLWLQTTSSSSNDNRINIVIHVSRKHWSKKRRSQHHQSNNNNRRESVQVTPESTNDLFLFCVVCNSSHVLFHLRVDQECSHRFTLEIS
jgi:hypothetical protein